MDTVINVLSLSIRLMIPVLLISLGGMFALKVDIFNLALDGFALFGCFAAVAGAYFTGSVLMGIVVAVLGTMILSMLYTLFVLELRVDSVICAIAFNTICAGITRYMLVPMFGQSGRFILDTSLALKPVNIPFLSAIPVIGPILNNHTPLAYLALISVVLLHIMLYKTKFGFHMRMVGLNETAALAAGVNAKKVRYGAMLACGGFCGLAGAQLALSLNMFNIGMTDGRGFTALAVLIMSGSRPVVILLACLLFGFSDAMVLQLSGMGLNSQLLGMLPYVLALIVAIAPLLYKKIRMRMKKRAAENKHMLQTGELAGE